LRSLHLFLHGARAGLNPFLLIVPLILNIFTIISFEPPYALTDYNFNAAGDWGQGSWKPGQVLIQISSFC
jgi:hypothetical protein